VNLPNPALVSKRGAQRLPRPALWLLCAAYLLPGLFGRDPWKSADITAFGYMFSLAQGHSSWLNPTVAGLPADGALLPYWFGAGAIELLSPWVDSALAARSAFALLLSLVLILTWYSSFHLARTQAAQPLPFAFGGEAQPVDYARAIADGALLALIASLGLLQLGHETTPELGQLTGMALFMYAMACKPAHKIKCSLAMLSSLPIMAASGAPSMALVLCGVGVVVCLRSSHLPMRVFAWWPLAAGALAAVITSGLQAWHWRLAGYGHLQEVALLFRQLLWFMWPAWPLALWTLWRWRTHLLSRHIAVPLSCTIVALLAWITTGGSNRTLLLTLPPLAVLASFALPTLQRSTAAALDWFSVFFFSLFALAIWVMYAAMHTGMPAKPAANIAKLVVDFKPIFSWVALLLACLGTVAWLWLVKWRTGRNRHPLWKSLVLPAAGVALCWLMMMTLWLPLLDYVRSYRPLIERIALHVKPQECIAAPGMGRAQLAALAYFGPFQVEADTSIATTQCNVLLLNESKNNRVATPKGWQATTHASRPADRNDITVVYRRLVPRHN
jgi:hypothetical protein